MREPLLDPATSWGEGVAGRPEEGHNLGLTEAGSEYQANRRNAIRLIQTFPFRFRTRRHSNRKPRLSKGKARGTNQDKPGHPPSLGSRQTVDLELLGTGTKSFKRGFHFARARERARTIMCDCPEHLGRLTPEEIDAARTPAGGWTRAQLATWGVPWPPPRGWRTRLIHGADLIPLTADTGCAYCRDHGLVHDHQFSEGRYHYREANARLDLANERGCFMRDIPDADVAQRMEMEVER